MIQEALTNVVKHAQAGHAHVAVVEHEGWIDLSVVDDGIGFTRGARDDGFGLLGMAERALLG